MSSRVRAAVKVGGGLSAIAGELTRVGQGLATLAGAGVVVVPGGGPFASAVRDFDRRYGLPAEAAHWMAILGMDQYGHAIAAVTPGSALVESASEITEALDRGRVPVLVPYRWLRTADELPHSWEVTSDSLAAYLAGLLGAERFLLVKPRGGGVAELTDDYFTLALPMGIRCRCIGVEDLATGLAWAKGDPAS